METETARFMGYILVFLFILIAYGLLFIRKQDLGSGKKYRHSFLFSEELYSALNEMSDFFKKDRSETIQLALILLVISKEALVKGSKVMIVDKNGKSTEIIFPDGEAEESTTSLPGNVIRLFPNKK